MSSATVSPAGSAGTPLTHRQILEVLSGLLAGMLTAILSSTVVSTSLPKIVSDLGGTQTTYTWVVIATLLAMTVTTPLWGKLADLLSRKVLIQIALLVFVAGSVLAGMSESAELMIACRVLQGVGTGGLTALTQVILSDIVSPRERGRYMGYLGAVMAVGTVSGPLIGGILTDSVGWRWNFYVCVPLALVAFVVLQRTLKLPVVRRKVSIDYLGAILLSAGVSGLLIWVTLAGKQFEWWSITTALLLGSSLVSLVLAVVAERRAPEPILPLWLFGNRTFVLAIIASAAVGVAMFSTSVYLSQYMQLARGQSPTETGLLTIPMAVGVLVSGTVVGRIITRTGRWKRWMVLGSVLLIGGIGMMGTIDYQTNYVAIGVYLLATGLGVGMVMQNLVLAVQNTIPVTEIGAASAGVAFFRSLGGSIGVSALGALLGSRVSALSNAGFRELGVPVEKASAGSGAQLPDPSKLPPEIRTVVEQAFGGGVADVFKVATVLAVVGLIAILAIKEIPLGTRSGLEQRSGDEAATSSSGGTNG